MMYKLPDELLDMDHADCIICKEKKSRLPHSAVPHPKSPWISVKDRLPKQNVAVLVTFYAFNDPSCDRIILMGKYCAEKYSPDYGWITITEGDTWKTTIYTPTHWMPLPDPPGD